jgi:hypothetical protein
MANELARLRTYRIGRTSYVPTAEISRLVEAMAGYGVPHIDISKVVGINHKTLAKYYRRELDTGHIKANSEVAASLFKQATEGNNVAAAIWWSKARMGWSETHKHAGADGGPMQVIVDTGISRE